MRGRRFLVLVTAGAASAVLGLTSVAQAAPTVTDTKTRSYSAATPIATPAKKGKKKKKGKPAVSRTASVGLPPSSTQTGAASCPKGTHMSGGGYQVTPVFDLGVGGTRSLTVNSHSSGARAWTARADAYATPPNPGTFTTAVRCEKNSLGKLAVTIAGDAVLPPATGGTLNLTCPPGTHVLSGGYDGTGLGAYTYAASSQRTIVLGSRRTGPAQWTISAYGQGVSEASRFAPLVSDGRTTAGAGCGKKAHVVSGGFLVSPATFPGSVPMVSIDQSMPAGKRGWNVSAWDYPFGDPVGSTLQTIAYCKKG